MVKPRTRKTKKPAKPNVIVVSGKRKRALAKATIREGKGEIKINQKSINLLPEMQILVIKEPLLIAQKITPDVIQKVDINVTAIGGGTEAQIEASRLAIARALVAFTKSKELRDAFLAYDRHLIIADIRRKETRKPGDSKARAKRQKSYR